MNTDFDCCQSTILCDFIFYPYILCSSFYKIKIQYIKSQHGKLLLQLNSFQYSKNKVHKGLEYWRL